MFSSAMRADQSENGENSTNSVRAQDDGAAINTISGMFVTPAELTLTLTPLLCGHNSVCSKICDFKVSSDIL